MSKKINVLNYCSQIVCGSACHNNFTVFVLFVLTASNIAILCYVEMFLLIVVR